FGSMFDRAMDSFYMRCADSDPSQTLTLVLVAIDPGTYDATGAQGRIELFDQSPGGGTAISFGEGASGTITVAGQSSMAMWGDFEARVCAGDTCTSIYQGRFAALLP